LLDDRRVLAGSSSTIEGRRHYSITGTVEMGADEKKDIKKGF
jgi:hypothetical protein